MKISARLRVGELLEEFPEVDEVFENHDVEITEEHMEKTLKSLCKAEGIDWIDLKADLREAVGWDGSAEFDEDEDDDDDEDWYEEEEEEEEEEPAGDDLDLGDDDDLDEEEDDDEEEEDLEDEDD